MTDEARGEGFYWVVLGHNPPEIASNGASGGSPATPGRGTRMRCLSPAIGWCSGRSSCRWA